jgi:hypothetical protein
MLPQLTLQLEHLFSPYDLYERHSVAGMLLQQEAGAPPQTVLDVGGRVALLESYIPYRVVTLNPDATGHILGSGGALPFGPAAFSAVVSIDTLEHLPPAARAPFIRECLRVARRAVVLAAPLGSPAHVADERALDALYRQAYGRPHPYLAEHIAYGLPTVDDLAGWRTLPGVAQSRALYAGDFIWQGRGFARSIRASQLPRWRRLGANGLHRLASMAILHPIRLSTAPQPTTNRFYLVLRKNVR